MGLEFQLRSQSLYYLLLVVLTVLAPQGKLRENCRAIGDLSQKLVGAPHQYQFTHKLASLTSCPPVEKLVFLGVSNIPILYLRRLLVGDNLQAE